MPPLPLGMNEVWTNWTDPHLGEQLEHPSPIRDLLGGHSRQRHCLGHRAPLPTAAKPPHTPLSETDQWRASHWLSSDRPSTDTQPSELRIPVKRDIPRARDAWTRVLRSYVLRILDICATELNNT